MTGIDWFIVVACLGVLLGMGLDLSRKAVGNRVDFCVSGRSLPGWWAETSLASPAAIDALLRVGVSGVFAGWHSDNPPGKPEVL